MDTGSGRKVGFVFGKTECGSFGDPGSKMPKKLLVDSLAAGDGEKEEAITS